MLEHENTEADSAFIFELVDLLVHPLISHLDVNAIIVHFEGTIFFGTTVVLFTQLQPGLREMNGRENFETARLLVKCCIYFI